MCHAFSAHHGCKPLADGLAPLPELLASKLATPHADAVWQEVDNGNNNPSSFFTDVSWVDSST